MSRRAQPRGHRLWSSKGACGPSIEISINPLYMNTWLEKLWNWIQWFIDFKHIFSEGTCDMLSPAKKTTCNMLKPSICLMETRRKKWKIHVLLFQKTWIFHVYTIKKWKIHVLLFPKTWIFQLFIDMLSPPRKIPVICLAPPRKLPVICLKVQMLEVDEPLYRGQF